MDQKDLEEYSAREKESASEAFYRITNYQRLCESRGETPELRELAKLAYQDKIQFGKSYAYIHAGDLPLAVVLPFYEQIVVNLPPYKKPEDFVKYVGTETKRPEEAAQALARKIKQQRVLVILSDTPLTYKGMNYLDPILELEPPSGIRTYAFFQGITNGTSSAYVEEALRALNRYPALEIGYVDTIHKELDNTKASVDHLLICASSYACLCSLGYEELAKSILNLPMRTPEELRALRELVKGFDPNPTKERLAEFGFNASGGLNRVINLMYIYTRYLSDPIASGFCGTPVFGPKERKLASQFNIQLKEETLFPTEIGYLLRDAYDLTFPLNPDLDIVDKMYVDSAIVHMRRILSEFNEKMRRKENVVGSELEDIRKVFLESREAILNVDKAATKLKWGAGLISLGVMSAPFLSQDPAVRTIGFLAMLGYKIKERRVLERFLPRILRTKIDPLAVAIWQFEKKYYDYKSVTDFRKTSEGIRKRVLED